MPNKMIEAYPEVRQTLEYNQHRLTSPLDLYRTLLHLASPSFPAANTGPLPLELGKAVSPNTISYNLFTEQVPKNRTCLSAGIGLERCWAESSKGPWELHTKESTRKPTE